MFFIIVAGTAFLAPFYLFWRLIWALEWRSWWHVAAWAAFEGAAVGLPLLLRFGARHEDSELASWLLRIGYSAFGLHVQLLLLSLGREILWVPLRLLVLRDAGLRQLWWSRSAALTGALAVVFWLVGMVQASGLPQVRIVQIPIPDLPRDLEGFRIVHLSDIHLGPWKDGRHLAAIVAQVNGLTPDIIAITGDLVDASVESAGEDARELAGLQAPVYFVTGNHEYYWGGPRWVEFLRRQGIRVLDNEVAIVRKGAGRILLAGVPDPAMRRFAPPPKLDSSEWTSGEEKPHVRILLAHRPEAAHLAARAGFDLLLSGHTHGGQFFPFTLLIDFFQPFPRGLNRLGKLWIYTSRGVGFWGPPMRTFNPPEIAVIELARAR